MISQYVLHKFYSQLTVNDSVTARPPTIVRETFSSSTLWGAAIQLVSSSDINVHRTKACLVVALNIE